MRSGMKSFSDKLNAENMSLYSEKVPFKEMCVNIICVFMYCTGHCGDADNG